MPLALLLAALSVCIPAAGAAQAERGMFASYAADGGATALTESRFVLHTGYTVGGTGPSGAYAGARYVAGAHWLRANDSALAERFGAGEVQGGGGTLYDTGIAVELGWKLGPVRPYWYRGYHYHRQTLYAATVTTGTETAVVPAEQSQRFGRAGGYGALLLLPGGSGAFAERFTGGGGEVMEVTGVRFGLRVAW